MDDIGDSGLLSRWRERDEAAFAALVARHEGALLHHARALVGSLAEDAVQEAFLQLAKSPPEAVGADPADGRASLSSWLHVVVRSRCMDMLKSERRRRDREVFAAPGEAAEGGQAQVDQGDTREAVRRAMEGLPPDQREVLVLRLLGGKSYREIAEITGRRIGTVGWLVAEGVKALGARLEPLARAGGA
jgi:RNA polymerase sigma-70 factor (ECF subfamily)